MLVPIAASVPVYLVVSSLSPHTGGVAPVNVPQSVTTTSSLADSGLAPSESLPVPRESVNVPLSEPVFWMSTRPVLAGPPGRMLLALSTAVAALELPIVSVPEANVFAGFADEAVKSAPEPTTAPAASSSVKSAPSARRGCAARAFRRDMRFGSLAWGGALDESGASCCARRRQPSHLVRRDLWLCVPASRRVCLCAAPRSSNDLPVR